jgi:hypothetical protein
MVEVRQNSKTEATTRANMSMEFAMVAVWLNGHDTLPFGIVSLMPGFTMENFKMISCMVKALSDFRTAEFWMAIGNRTVLLVDAQL